MDRYTVKKISFNDPDDYVNEWWFANKYDCLEDFLDDYKDINGSFWLFFDNDRDTHWFEIVISDENSNFIGLFFDNGLFQMFVNFLLKNKDHQNVAIFLKESGFETYLKERCVNFKGNYYPYVSSINNDGVRILDFGDFLVFDDVGGEDCDVLNGFLSACKEHLQRDFLIKVEMLSVQGCGKLENLEVLNYFDGSVKTLFIIDIDQQWYRFDGDRKIHTYTDRDFTLEGAIKNIKNIKISSIGIVFDSYNCNCCLCREI